MLMSALGGLGVSAAAADAMAGRVLAGNATRLYRLEGPPPGPVSAHPGVGRTPRR